MFSQALSEFLASSTDKQAVHCRINDTNFTVSNGSRLRRNEDIEIDVDLTNGIHVTFPGHSSATAINWQSIRDHVIDSTPSIGRDGKRVRWGGWKKNCKGSKQLLGWRWLKEVLCSLPSWPKWFQPINSSTDDAEDASAVVPAVSVPCTQQSTNSNSSAAPSSHSSTAAECDAAASTIPLAMGRGVNNPEASCHLWNARAGFLTCS